MNEKNWKYPAAMLAAAVSALLVAGAFREMDSASRAAGLVPAGISESAPATDSAPATNAEPPSNDIADFPQLD
jgi:hypothetical protein